MPPITLNSCCGYIELRTGCLIIGYLQLVLEVMAGIIVFIKLGNVAVSVAVDVGRSVDSANQEEDVDLVVMFVTLLLALVFALSFTTTLLVGVHKNKRGHVRTYMACATIFLVLGIIFSCLMLLIDNGAGSIITNLLLHAVNLYFLLVVRSYYYRMAGGGLAA